MAITIDIDTARPYQVHVGTFLLEQAGPLVRATAGGTKAVIVTDTNVGPLYQMPVKQSLESADYEVSICTFEAGEAHKRAETYVAILEFVAEHDRVIAFTSQLAHVVSNAYVKSPTAQVHHGFSAVSYRDLTRVAHLNPQMWSELMIDDANALAFEIDHLIESLGAYSRALKDRDQRYLENLLAEGDRIKRALDDEASH